jgi:ankyrin repeat protein
MSILSNLTLQQYESILLDEMTLLHHVAFDGNLEVLQMLKTLPYYKEIVDLDNNEMGWTPLLWAASRGDMEMTRALVDSGAELLKGRKDGITVLHVGASNNDLHLLDYTY